MANSASARKRAKQSIVRRNHNVTLRSRGRTAIKKVDKLLDAKDLGQAKVAFTQAQSTLDTLASKGIFSKNKVSRHKSRLNKRIKVLWLSLEPNLVQEDPTQSTGTE